MRKHKGKYLSETSIKTIRRLLDGHRLQHGYKLVKRKKRPYKKQHYKLF